MSFNLPAAQHSFQSTGADNLGNYDGSFSILNNGLKVAGGLPINGPQATEISNAGGSEGIIFGLAGQTDTTQFNASNNTKLALGSFSFNAPNRVQIETLALRGVTFRLISGGNNNNYREYKAGGNDTQVGNAQNGYQTICLDLSAGDEDASGGTYDNSQASGWGFGVTKANLAGTSTSLSFFQRFFIFDTGKGEANLPTFTGTSDFEQALALIQGNDYTDKIGAWLTKSGSSFFIPIPFSFGDGSSAVDFNDQGVSIVSPANNAPGQENFRLTNQAMRVYLDTRDNVADSVILTGSYSWGTAAPWDFDISNNSTCDLSGNFVGMGDFTIGSSVKAGGNFNLASGSSVICNGANIDDINVTENIQIQGDSVTSFNGITAGSIDFDTAGTYSLSGCNIGEVTNSSGGNVIINSSNTTIATNTGPNITINATTAFALTGLQPNSEVRIYEAGTTTEITGVENSGTTFITTLSFASVDIVILNLQYLAIKLKNVDTTADLALPIQQVFDRQYENP